MHDSKSQLENYNELKFSREQGFFDKSLGIRIFIGFIFTLALFAILHFREVRIDILELSSIAPSYIVAQVDIDFLDEEETIIQKQEAIHDIGKIYQVSDKEIHKRRNEFEKYLVSNQQWRDKAEQSTFNEMYKGVDTVEKTLLLLNFTDPRTLKKMREMSFPTTNYLIFTISDISEPHVLPKGVWDYVTKMAFSNEAFHQGTIDLIIDYFQSKEWLTEEDVSSQISLREQIQSEVQDVYTPISAGSRIIDQGEKVSSRHIAILHAMKEALSEKRNLWLPLTLSGSLILTLVLVGISAAYLYANYPYVLQSNRKLFLLVTVMILTFGIAKATEFIFLSSKSNLIEVIRYPLFVPFAAILLCSLMNSAVATFASGFLAIVLSVALSFDQQGFLIMNLSSAMVAVFSARSLRQRREIFVVCAKAWLTCIVVIVSIHLYQNTFWHDMFADSLSSVLFMLLTSVTVVGLLPLLESTFHVMTDVTLMEYMDPNHDLLRRLSIEAPGTYQHSVVVGNLAETAAQAVGANGLFCRVSTLYHDIGKMVTPQYFTENQQEGMNIHQLLTPQESAQVIIAHVSEGVAMARKAGLPEQFIDIIKEHHGTTLVYCFYQKQIEKMDGDPSRVEEKEFRYAGPKPRNKESAIIMIADTLEAASRSLDQVDEETIREMTIRLVKEKQDDGQFDECLLTCEELSIIKETLIKTLVAFGHSRVKYPKKRENKVEEEKVPVGVSNRS